MYCGGACKQAAYRSRRDEGAGVIAKSAAADDADDLAVSVVITMPRGAMFSQSLAGRIATAARLLGGSDADDG